MKARFNILKQGPGAGLIVLFLVAFFLPAMVAEANDGALARAVKLLEQGEKELDWKSLEAAERIFGSECSVPRPSDFSCAKYLARVYIAEYTYFSQIKNDPAKSSEALSKAEQAALEAVEKNPKDAGAHVLLGKVYQIKMSRNPILGLAQAAVEDSPVVREYNKALELDPENGEAELGLGQYYLFLPKFLGGDYHRARSHFKQAAKYMPENPEPFVWIATSYRMQGRVVKARVFLDRALALDPNNAFALAENQRLEQAEKEMGEN